MPDRKPRPIVRDTPPEPAPEATGLLADVAFEAAVIGEWLRRGALGLTAALFVARSYWPAEASLEEDSGSGLEWSLLMLCAALVAALGAWLVGDLRVRASRADFGVFVLFLCVAISARVAPERRIGLNFAWEWIGVGVGYLLLRNLPRTRSEVSTLATVLVAVAVALAAYGLYQAWVEHPRDRALFLTNPREALTRAGMDPKAVDPQMVSRLRDRLVGSREPVATFALTNTLAGILVGPCAVLLIMSLRGLAIKKAWWVVAKAAPVALLLVVVLLMTKSRSAYLGLIASMIGLAWCERGRTSLKTIAILGLALAVVAGGLVATATLAGQLDRQVVTEAAKSLSYRAEYWQGAWGVIREGPNRWLTGYGPRNFFGPYLRHKPIGASEEISDPHNLFLEVWTTAGVVALVGLLAGLAFGLRACFARPGEASTPVADDEPDPPGSSTWLLVAAGLGGALIPVALGRISPFEFDPAGAGILPGLSARWLILSASLFLAYVLMGGLWRHVGITADALGLGALAIGVNLLAAGGIGFAPVALMLWGFLALGQNLREDRASAVRSTRYTWGWTIALMAVATVPSILIHPGFLVVPAIIGGFLTFGGRVRAFVVLIEVTAIIGTFFGTVSPFWKAETAIQSAKVELRKPKPDLAVAEAKFAEAARLDPLGSRAWIGRADLEFENWRRGGGNPMMFAWHKIDSILKLASERPRNPSSLRVHRLRGGMARAFLEGPELVTAERTRIRTDRVHAYAAACAIYPTSAALRAEFAEALADADRFAEAAEHGVKATKLDEAMPHADKKLPPQVRTRLIQEIPRWRMGRR